MAVFALRLVARIFSVSPVPRDSVIASTRMTITQSLRSSHNTRDNITNINYCPMKASEMQDVKHLPKLIYENACRYVV